MSSIVMTCRAHNVVSKSLAEYVLTVITEAVEDAAIYRQFLGMSSSPELTSYDFSTLVEYVEMCLDNLIDDGKITHHDVIVPFKDATPLPVTFTVQFKQRDCLVYTRIDVMLESQAVSPAAQITLL